MHFLHEVPENTPSADPCFVPQTAHADAVRMVETHTYRATGISNVKFMPCAVLIYTIRDPTLPRSCLEYISVGRGQISMDLSRYNLPCSPSSYFSCVTYQHHLPLGPALNSVYVYTYKEVWGIYSIESYRTSRTLLNKQGGNCELGCCNL